MRLRAKSRTDEAFDGLTAEEVRRIRGAAAANVTPGMEGLDFSRRTEGIVAAKLATREITDAPKKKRGRRA